MKATLLDLLVKLRIFDSDDFTLSFTSLYLFLGIAVCMVQPATVHTVALLTLIFTHTNLKRYSRHKQKAAQDQTALKTAELQAKTEQISESNAKRIEAVESEVQKLVQASNFRGLGQ